MSTNSQPSPLTDSQKSHFLTHGYVRIPHCFSRSSAASITSNVWTRLAMSPTDKSTWHTHRTNMPAHHTFSAKEFAPKAWDAICELLGGEERISEGTREWNDGLIVNLGSAEDSESGSKGEGEKEGTCRYEGSGDGTGEEEVQHLGKELNEWHVDGDFFRHFLDSPEQGLLVIPLFTDIRAGGGGTVICPPAIAEIAKYLHQHPEGVPPLFIPDSDSGALPHRLRFFNDLAASFPASSFVEVTGEVGDVFLLHPFMLHSASKNRRRDVRIITNPPVALKDPLCFDREGGDGYSFVERKTLMCLGVERLVGWEATGERGAVVPERVRLQRKMREEELLRLGGRGVVCALDDGVAVSA